MTEWACTTARGELADAGCCSIIREPFAPLPGLAAGALSLGSGIFVQQSSLIWPVAARSERPRRSSRTPRPEYTRVLVIANASRVLPHTCLLVRVQYAYCLEAGLWWSLLGFLFGLGDWLGLLAGSRGAAFWFLFGFLLGLGGALGLLAVSRGAPGSNPHCRLRASYFGMGGHLEHPRST